MKLLAKKYRLRGSGSADGMKLHSLRGSLSATSAAVRATELQHRHGTVPKAPPSAVTPKPLPQVSPASSTTPDLRKLWNRSMPVLNCSSCAFSSSCPSFRAGFECAFLPFLTAHKINTPEDILFYAKELLQQNLRRAQQAMMMETMSGAAPSLELSESLHGLLQQLLAMHDKLTEKSGEEEITKNPDNLVGGLFGNIGTLLEATRSAEKAIVGKTDLLSVQSPTAKKKPEAQQDLLSGVSLPVD